MQKKTGFLRRHQGKRAFFERFLSLIVALPLHQKSALK
jgi:hypothetical protein